MAAETGFKIDGTIYEIPTLDTLTMDEAQILYDYSGLSLDEFAPAEDEDDEGDGSKFKNPGLLRALLHIAYQRGNPKTPAAKVKALVGAASIVGVLEALAEEEDDALPPASTTEPDESSPRSSVDSNASSGIDLAPDTAEPDVPLVGTTDGSSPPSESTRPILVP